MLLRVASSTGDLIGLERNDSTRILRRWTHQMAAVRIHEVSSLRPEVPEVVTKPTVDEESPRKVPATRDWRT